MAHFILFACGTPTPTWTDFQTAQFFGAGKITANNDGTWTLWWPVLGVSDGVSYNIYQTKAGEPFDFEKSITNTAGNTFQTNDLRLVGNSCFVVRVLQYGEKIDSNTKEVCTHHEAYQFTGIKELVSLKDGTYMVRWDPPPFSGAVFQIFTRKKNEENLSPIAFSEQSFHQTAKIPLSESMCFVVRHRIQGFPEDPNIKELCTNEEQVDGFSGIELITSPSKGAIKIWWKPSTRSDVTNYKLYLGSNFRRPIALLSANEVCSKQIFNEEDRVWCTYEQSNLPHAAAYTYAVRAVDIYEREDDNRKVKTFELTNHPPVITSVNVVPVTGIGRPNSVTCNASYSDLDSWQTLKPTFVFKNRKRERVGDVELQRENPNAGMQSSTYTLSTADRHGDVIVCEVSVADGFGGTHVLRSAPTDPTQGIGTSFVIPDTPSVATSVFDVSATLLQPAYVYGVRNTVREITISLGSGYSDIDADPAQSITVTNVFNGNVCLISDAACTVDGVGLWSNLPKTFPCDSDGTCKIQFVPGKDHFTNPSNLSATLAKIEYKINVADVTLADGTISVGSTSSTTGQFSVNVRPAPRATGFSFKDGHQDETYLLTKTSVPQLSSGVLRGFTTGTGWMGYESSLKITKMYTRISSNASDQSSERPNGEFDVAQMIAKGEPGVTCKAQNYTINESTDATKPIRTSYTDCEIQCRTPKPQEIDRIYGTTGGLGEAELNSLKNDPSMAICPFLFKPDPGFYGNAVFYYSVVDVNGLPSDYARAEINFTPSLRAIGHKLTVIEEETANINFTESPDGVSLTGFDGSSEDVNVTGILVKDSQIMFADQGAPLFFICPSGSNSCNASVSHLTANGSWPGYGHASYIYRVRGFDTKNNKVIDSNWCPAQSAIDPSGCEVDVHFYPKPRPTNPEFFILESSTSQISFLPGSRTSSTGYFHPYSDNATALKIKNYDNSKATITALGGATSGDVSCGSGACSLSIETGKDPCAGNWAGCSMNVNYSVVTTAPADSGLDTLARRNIESASGTSVVSIRPIPVANDMSFIKPEGKSFTITLTLGTQSAVNGSTGGYTYPISGIVASSIEVIGTIPDGGSLAGSGFTCNSISCTAIYNPGANFTGITSFPFKVSVFDTRLNKNVQSQNQGLITITIRPVAKATGLSGTNKIIAVEGSAKDFYIKLGTNIEKVGYTHLENIAAQIANTSPTSGIVSQVSNSMPMGTIMDRGGGVRFGCNAQGECLGTFNPLAVNSDWPGYGEGKFGYNVTVDDPALGSTTSNTADAFMDVRPLPRAIGDQTKPNGPPSYITVEGLPRVFSMSLGNGYTHPYNYKAAGLLITDVQNGTTSDVGCDTSGVCSFTLTPNVNFFGNSIVQYKIRTLDALANFEPFNGALLSAAANTAVQVYPRPISTNQNIIGLQNRTTDLIIEPNSLANNNGGGYSHPYGDKAYCVKTENPRNGALSDFKCDTAGKCNAQFTPANNYYSTSETDTAGFDFYVFVHKDGVPLDTVGVCPDGITGLPLVSSKKSSVNINVRPIPVATGLTVVNKQAESFVVELRHGDGLGYKDRATPIRPASGAAFVSSVSSSTVGTFTSWDCATEVGVCRSTFTPAGTDVNAFFGDAEISYVVYMYDPMTAITVESDPGKLRLRVRPRPIGSVVTSATKQGQNHPLVLSTSPTVPPVYTHPFNYKAYRVETRGVVNGLVKDASNNDGFSCSPSGLCESFFRPSQTSGDYYWGTDARFEYRVVVNDPILAAANSGVGDVEGFWKTYNIDYRPVAEPTGLVGNVFVREGGTTQVHLNWGSKAEKKGYAHGGPSFHLPAYSVTATPLAGFLGNIGLFSCNSSTETCSATYTAPISGTTYGTSEFSYRLSVNDPILGILDSYTTQKIQVQVKPAPKTMDKSVKGVQNAIKNIVLSPGSGYTYPVDFLSSLVDPKLIAEPIGTAIGGTISAFSCNAGTGFCTATFNPSTDYTGEASFQFRVRVFDPDLGELTSNISTYKIDYYPSPVAIPLVRTTKNHILGIEGSAKTFSFLPAKIGTEGFPVFCVSNHASLNLPHGYKHPLCSPAVEILIDPESQTNALVTAPFTCDTQGVCTGTVTPNAIVESNASWKGYGFASFMYRVRINPEYLATETLTPAEIANLTSLPAQVEVEYVPLPKTRDLDLWAVEDYQTTYAIDKCDDSLIADCNKGYVHGYNYPASSMIVTSPVNLSTAGPFSCDAAGLCTGSIKSTSGYFSSQSDSKDRATLEFKVKVSGTDTNTSKLKFNVYPRLKATPTAEEGVQNEEIDVTYRPSKGYTHAADGTASFVSLMAPEGGVFLNTSNCVLFEDGTCKKYSCNTGGLCVGRFRPGTSMVPMASFWGNAKVYFRVEMNGPPGMPTFLRPALISDWKETNISILPKPLAGNPEIVLKENSSIPFGLRSPSGYTHPLSGEATKIELQGASVVGGVVPVFGAGSTQKGSLALSEFDCKIGICSNVFTPLVNMFGTATLNFKVIVQADNRLISDNIGTMTFDIRPIPDSLNTGLAYEVEGTPYPFEIGQDNGYFHPFNVSDATIPYPPKRLTTTSFQNGTLGTWDYTANPKAARNVFTPSSSWIPDASDNIASFLFSVSADDPKIGPVDSDTLQKGKVEIEYRPKPRAIAKSFIGLENSNKTIAIGFNSGYTHAHSLKASDIEFKDLSHVSLLTKTCSVDTGLCTITFDPEDNFYGDATAQYRVKTIDPLLPPTKKDLWSNWATLTIDFRPLPRPVNFITKSPQDNNALVKIGIQTGGTTAYSVAYTHPYFDIAQPSTYVAKLLKITNLSGGSFTGSGVTENAGLYTIPCTAAGVCSASFVPAPDYTGSITYKFNVTITDPVLGADVVSPLGDAEIRVRPVAIALAFNIAAAENKPSESRPVRIEFGASPKKGFDYPYTPALNIHNVTVVNQDNLNGTLTSFTCQSGICYTDYTPSAGYKGAASFTFKVWVNDPDLGPVASNTTNTANIDVRARPTISSFSKAIAENTVDHPTTTSILVSLNNSGSSGYKQVNNLKAFEIVASGATNGVIAGTSCVESTGVCTVDFTPSLGFSGANSSFAYTVKVHDIALSSNPANNILESDEGVITLPVRTRPVAQNVTFYAAQGSYKDVVIAKGTTSGYNHALYDANGVVVKTWDNSRLLSEPNFSCEGGICTSRFTAKDATVLGSSTVNYQVKITDPVLGADLLSNTAAAKVNFKGSPKIAGSPHAIATLESTPIILTFAKDDKYAYDDTENWNSVKGSIKVNVSITGTSPKGKLDGDVTSKLYNCDLDGICNVTYTPSVNQYGTEVITYSVSLTDSNLGVLSSSTSGTINLKIRPRPHATTVAAKRIYENVSNVLAQEGGELTFTEGVEFTYPYKSDPSEFLNMRIALSNPTKGLLYNGNALVNSLTNVCNASNVCNVKYIPNVGEKDGASLSYKIIIFDKVLNRDVESVETSTAGIDIYPRPVCNDVNLYATQGETPTVRITSGSGKGYTHDRNDVASAATRIASSNLNGDVNTATISSCISGNCDFIFTPSPAAFFTSQDGNTKAKFDFKVTVGGISSYTACAAQVTLRPKPITEPAATVYVFEGRTKTVSFAKSTSLGGNLGYYHPYTDDRGKAKTLDVEAVLGGTTDAISHACSSGSCDVVFNPSIVAANAAANAYGAGKSSFGYKVTTNIGTNPSWDVTSLLGTQSLNLRPVPKVQNLTLKMIENTPLTFNIGIGHNQYIWGVSALTQESPNLAEAEKVNGFDTNPTFNCGAPPCVSTLQTSSNFSRGASGTSVAQFRYRVRTRDPVSETDVYSHTGASNTWPLVSIDVAPRPRAIGSTLNSGREGVALPIALERGSGYTHAQNFNASSIEVVSCSNCGTPAPTFDCTSPGSTGRCTATITPATNFTSISGEPVPPGEGAAFNHTGKPYGWSRIEYKVKVTDSNYGGVIESPSTNYIWVYFRPVPRSTPYSTGSPLIKNDGIEDSVYALSLISGAGWSYDRSSDRKPSSMVASNVSGGDVQGGSCSSGSCSFNFSSPSTFPTFGTLSFDYHVRVTDPDNTVVSSSEKPGAGPGRVSVKFRARPRVQDIGNAQLVTSAGGVSGGYAVETCKADATHDTTALPTFTIGKATFNATTGSATSTTGYYHWENFGPSSLTVQASSSSGGSVTTNSCDGTSCTVKWQPRCWNEGEDQLTGQFQYKMTDTQSLESKGSPATATIVAIPRVKTTGRMYPKGDGTQGITGESKTVQIALGSGNGYTHIYSGNGKYATSIKIVGGSGFSSPAVNSTVTNCSAGTCTFNITPTVADNTANLEYHVYDGDNFVSHNRGNLSVYFISRPISNSVSQVVPQGSSSNVLTINLGAGYTHPANEKATSIVITNTANLQLASGTSLNDSSFQCSNGTCTALYTPNPSYSSAEGVPAQFKYKVKIGNDVISNTEGTYNIDVYPKPTIRNQDLYWVQGLGRHESGIANDSRFNISLTKGSSPAAYSTRGSDVAYSIEETSFLTGSGSWSQGFICDGSGNCTGKFNPSGNLYSSSTSVNAVAINYRVRVRKGTVNIDSEPGQIRIFIMPAPQVNNNSINVWEDGSKEFRFVESLSGYSASPELVEAFSFPWSGWTKSASILSQPTTPMTVDTFNCSYAGGGCWTRVNPNDIASGPYTFTYTLTAAAGGNWPLPVTSSAGTTTVTVNPILGAADYSTPTQSQPGNAQISVQVELNRGEEWFDYKNPASGTLSSIQVESPLTDGDACSGRSDRLRGSLTNFSSIDGGITWKATFTSAVNGYGYACYSYHVRRVVGAKTYKSTARLLQIFIKPEDQPAEVCNKSLEGTAYLAATNASHGTSVIAYPGQVRLVKAKRGSCTDDGWYLDPDNNSTDKATQLIFTQIPSSGSITSCTSNDCSIACDTDGHCPFTYNPPGSNGTATFKYKVVTQNSLMGVTKLSPEATGKFQIVTPPNPEAKNRSVTVLEDNGVPLTISTSDNLSLKSLQEMGLRDGDDGYPWLVKTATWTGCDRSMNINPVIGIPCDTFGNCNLTIPTRYDSTDTTTCQWIANINNVNSTQGSVTATITPVDDAPQTYGQGNDLVAQVNNPQANESVHHYSYHSMCWSHTDWAATFKNVKTSVKLQGTSAANSLYSSDCLYEYGYMERDGDPAVEVQVQNPIGIKTLGAWTCVSGKCTAPLEPAVNFVGTATFQYKVKTCAGGVINANCKWQPSWSTYNLEVSLPDSKPIPKTGTSVVAQGGVAPIVFTHQWPPSGWDGVAAPTEAGKYYKRDFRDTASSNWWRTKYAKRVITSNLTGATSTDFTCDWDTGVCVGMYTAAPGFTGTGGFDFNLVLNEGLTVYSADTGWGSSKLFDGSESGTYPFPAFDLKVQSDSLRWPVTVKAVPIPTGQSFITAINQNLTVRLERGVDLGYTHAENSAASAITVQNQVLNGGTLGAFTCDASGVCTATFTPANNYEGTATFDYYVTDSQSPNKYTSTNKGTVTIQIKPPILLSHLTRADLTQGATVAITVARQAYPTSGSLTGEGYAHKDNLAAGSLTANTLINGTLSGTGVSCVAGTCTVNCAGDGDSNNDICSFNFEPSSTAFYGTAGFKYTMTVGSTVSVQKDATLTYKARPTLKSTTLLLSGVQGQDSTIEIGFNSVTTGEYGYTHPTSGKATALSISNLNNVSLVGSPTCNTSGLCTVTVRHATGGFGTTGFDYNVTVEGLQATAARAVSITFNEVPQTIPGKSITTDQDTTVSIPVNKDDEYTLTGGVGTKVVTSNATNGSTVDPTDAVSARTDFTCDASGTCNLKFKPTTGYAGNAASFNFVVHKDTSVSASQTFTVKVDGAPVTAARTVTNGMGGVAKAIIISLGSGYTDPNNDPATTLETQNVTEGTLSSFSCDSAGICASTFTPNLSFTGNATFEFRVTTKDATRNVSKTSGWSTLTLTTTAADQAPIASSRVLSNATRSGQSVTISNNNGYTDANGDKATSLNIISADGATTNTPSCNANGDCNFTVYAQAGTFGQSTIVFTVTANGKTSNSSVVAVNYATNSAYGCINNLTWSSLTLSDSCGLTLAATANLNTCSISSTSATIRNIDTGSVASNAGGLSATLTSFPETQSHFTATWNVVSDLDDSATLQRALKITTNTASELRIPTVASAPTRAQGMLGLQAPVAGCTGTCSIDYGAPANSLASSAGGMISVGSEFACSANGINAFCWGKNSYGQLGIGNNTDQSYAAPVANSNLSGAGIVAVSTGAEFACGLLTTGEVACWGRNEAGQLGDLSNSDSNVPVFVKRNTTTRLSNIVSIAASSNHVCAVSATKNVWCWGDGSWGTLGVNDLSSRNYASPAKVSGVNAAANLTNAISVSGGANHSCIIQDVSGTLKPLCWGRNDKGQLGRSTERNVTINVSSIDTATDRITSTAHGFSTGDAVTFAGSSTLPSAISSANVVYFVKKIDNNIVELLATSDALTSVDFTNQGSSLKLFKVFPFAAAMKADASTDVSTVQSLSLQSGTTCALLTNGTVRCAGDNANGATGLNTNSGTTDYASLVRNADNTGNLSNVVALSGGTQYACALLKGGTVQCWGANASGQLGNGTNVPAILPVTVSSLTGAVAIAGGGATTCALTRSVESDTIFGRVKCFGSNPSGMLGNGSNSANSASLGAAVKTDSTTLFQARLRDCSTIYQVTDAP